MLRIPSLQVVLDSTALQAPGFACAVSRDRIVLPLAIEAAPNNFSLALDQSRGAGRRLCGSGDLPCLLNWSSPDERGQSALILNGITLRTSRFELERKGLP